MANRGILGRFAGTYVLRFSRPGANVLDDNTPREQIAFDSRWNTLGRVFSTGSVRARVEYTDMLGSYLVSSLYLPAGYNGIPCVIANFTPDGNGAVKVPILIGNILWGGWDEAARRVDFGIYASYLPTQDNYQNGREYGTINYRLLRY